MERLKRWVFWTEEKLDSYHVPTYPSVMFWLITAICLIEFVQGVRIVVEYQSLLPASILWTAGIMLFMFPFTWIGYYRLHRRFKRLLEEGHPPDQRLLKEVQYLTIAFVLGAYILFNFGLMVLSRLLEKLYH